MSVKKISMNEMFLNPTGMFILVSLMKIFTHNFTVNEAQYFVHVEYCRLCSYHLASIVKGNVKQFAQITHMFTLCLLNLDN